MGKFLSDQDDKSLDKGASTSEASGQTKEKLCVQMILPDVRSAQKRTKSWVPINIHIKNVTEPYGNPLWLKIIHFLAFLVTFWVVRTTFMQLTSTERTQRPVTHTGW